MRKLFVVLLLISPLLTAAMPFMLLALAAWEPDDARPGSLAYLLVIPSKAKRFPLWEPCNAPSFSYRMRDGTAPEMYSIQYQSRLTAVGLTQMIDGYTRLQSCKYDGAPELPADGKNIGLDIVCGAPATQLQFVFPRGAVGGPACRPVYITFIEPL
jgi:hypothetical protein